MNERERNETLTVLESAMFQCDHGQPDMSLDRFCSFASDALEGFEYSDVKPSLVGESIISAMQINRPVFTEGHETNRFFYDVFRYLQMLVEEMEQ